MLQPKPLEDKKNAVPLLENRAFCRRIIYLGVHIRRMPRSLREGRLSTPP